MAPAWNTLMEKYADNPHAVVAEVDCTAGGKPLCDQVGVQGFPTLKWGDASALEDYDGARSEEALTAFAEENMKPLCNPQNIDLCEEEKAQIEKLQAMPASELAELIEGKEQEMKDAEALFETELEKLQKKYEEISAEKEATIKAVKTSGLGMMKAVRAAQPKEAEKD